MIFNAPKNFKSGRLILGRYRWIDLILLLSGILISLLSMIIYAGTLRQNNLLVVVVLFLPAAITYTLTMPTNGVYHNNLEFLRLLRKYSKSKRTYIWEGIYKEDDEA